MGILNRRKKKLTGLAIISIGIIILVSPFALMVFDDFASSYKIKQIEKEYSSVEYGNTECSNADIQKENKDIVSGNVKTDGSDEMKIDRNKPAGYLVIPKLKQKFILYLDADLEKISKGVAVLSESSLPEGGIGKRTVIAGHRGYYSKMMFFNINELEKDDVIRICYLGKKMEYRVTDKEKILDTDNEKLKPENGKDMLTLLTCCHAGDSNHRFIVNSQRADADKTPTGEMAGSNRNSAKHGNSEFVSYENDGRKKISEKNKGLLMKRVVPYVVTISGISALFLISLKIKNIF